MWFVQGPSMLNPTTYLSIAADASEQKARGVNCDNESQSLLMGTAGPLVIHCVAPSLSSSFSWDCYELSSACFLLCHFLPSPNFGSALFSLLFCPPCCFSPILNITPWLNSANDFSFFLKGVFMGQRCFYGYPDEILFLGKIRPLLS